MTAFLLVMLFTTVAAAAALTIADAAVRAQNALRHLRAEIVRSDVARVITVTMNADSPRKPTLTPALRPAMLIAGRSGRRCGNRTQEPLRAAA